MSSSRPASGNHKMFSDDQLELETIVDEFEESWLAGEAPEIAGFLPLEDPMRNRVLWELVQSELELRIKAESAEDHPRVEDYFDSFPELQEDRERLLELIYSEHRQKSRLDPSVRAAEYVERFPAFEEVLRDLDHVSLPERFRLNDSQPGIYHIDGHQVLVPNVANGQFRLLASLAEGGLGKVWHAIDEELGRPVALKEIKGDHADDPESRQRFVLETLITSGLQHPGIIPVYRIGHHKDGRPFYTMRLVEGKTLGDAITEFHDTDWSAEDPGARNVELRRLLGSILDASAALHYAHRRGVVHRDVKPANILIGDFGETLIVDWGLARMIGDDYTPVGSIEDAGAIDPLRLDEATQAMLISGTSGSPAFMSPEQARSDKDQLNPTTDVYSLGATLYALLTNRCPAIGVDAAEVIENVKQGKWTRPREVDRSIPAALESIVIKSMQLDPANRYASPRKLANDLEHFLANERVASHQESLSERMARFAKRHQASVRAAVAGLVCLTIVATGSAFLINKQRARAKARAESNERVLQFFDDFLRSPDPERDGRGVLFAEVLKKASETLDEGSTVKSPADEARIRMTLARTQDSLGLYESAAGNAKSAVNLFQQTGGPHARIVEAKNSLIHSNVELGKVDESIVLAAENLSMAERILPAGHEATDEARMMLAHAYTHKAKYEDALSLIQKVESARKLSLGKDDLLTIDSSVKKIVALILAERPDEAISEGQVALDRCREHLGTTHPLCLEATNNLAWAYKSAGDFEKAIPLYEQSLDGRRDVLGDQHGQTLSSINNLAIAYRKTDRLEEARVLLEEGLKTSAERFNKQHDSHLKMLNTLVLVKMSSGDFAGAIPDFEELIPRMRDKFGDCHPYVLGVMDSLASAHAESGDQATAERILKDIEVLKAESESTSD